MSAKSEVGSIDEREQNLSATLRKILLGITWLGIVGLSVELVFIEHWEKRWQPIPLALLGMAMLASIAVTWWPTDMSLRVFRIVMAMCVLAAPFGIWQHYSGNVEFELERRRELHGMPLIWKSLHGATPVLAPGALTQLGLLGLAFTFRHPALRRRNGKPTAQERT